MVMGFGFVGRRDTALATAIHEAGHAVAELAMPPSQSIEAIWLRRDLGGWSGMVDVKARLQPAMADLPISNPDHAKLYRDAQEARARQDIIQHAAGLVAEWRWRLRSRVGAQFVGLDFARVCSEQEHASGSDLDRVKVRLLWLGVPDIRAAFVEAWMEAEALLAREWRAVIGIGRALTERHRLDDEAVLALWAQHRSDPEPRRMPTE